jgi:predicted regulator of Ras-like GTPase activity (Roadblock/LC7/MglB family)
VEGVNGVECIVVFRDDGAATHSSLADGWLLDKVAALSSLLCEVGRITAAELGKGVAETITVRAGDGSGVVVFTGLGQARNLSVVFSKEAKLGVLLYTLRHEYQVEK